MNKVMTIIKWCIQFLQSNTQQREGDLFEIIFHASYKETHKIFFRRV